MRFVVNRENRKWQLSQLAANRAYFGVRLLHGSLQHLCSLLLDPNIGHCEFCQGQLVFLANSLLPSTLLGLEHAVRLVNVPPVHPCMVGHVVAHFFPISVFAASGGALMGQTCHL